MAKLNGIGGAVSGKFGNLVGFELRGKNFIKAKAKRTSPPTEGELQNQFIFELVQRWLQPLLEVVRVGFKKYSPNFEGLQAAISFLYREALTKNGYHSFIDPSLVKISVGPLAVEETMQVAYQTDLKRLHFSWSQSLGEKTSLRDRVLLLAYNVETSEAYYELSGPQRREGEAFLSLPAAAVGTFHIYAAFVAEDRNSQSDSVYLGHLETGLQD